MIETVMNIAFIVLCVYSIHVLNKWKKVADNICDELSNDQDHFY